MPGWLKHLTLSQAHSRQDKKIPEAYLSLCHVVILRKFNWSEQSWSRLTFSLQGNRMSARRGRVSETLISLLALVSLALDGFHIVSSAVDTRKYLFLPCNIQEDGWRFMGTESRARGQVALTFGAHRLTSRLQSKCSKLMACQIQPWLLFCLVYMAFNFFKLL